MEAPCPLMMGCFGSAAIIISNVNHFSFWLPIFCNWVLVAKGFSQPEHVLVYGSMPRTPWDNAHVLSCMSSLLKTPEKEMTYLVKTCQRQGNGFDCGVFAIAFATSLANGEDPATILYDPKKTGESPC